MGLAIELSLKIHTSRGPSVISAIDNSFLKDGFIVFVFLKVKGYLSISVILFFLIL